jgi:hypothetical protein
MEGYGGTLENLPDRVRLDIEAYTAFMERRAGDGRWSLVSDV